MDFDTYTLLHRDINLSKDMTDERNTSALDNLLAAGGRRYDIEHYDTVYRNVVFRSALEARYAMFFDALGLKWKYEPYRYDLGTYEYTPDFYVYGLDCFIEVKPTMPTEEEHEKCIQLAMETRKRVFCAVGMLGTAHFSQGRLLDPNIIAYVAPVYDGGEYLIDYDYAFTECPACKTIDITFNGRVNRVGCACADKPRYRWSERIHAAKMTMWGCIQ